MVLGEFGPTSADDTYTLLGLDIIGHQQDGAWSYFGYDGLGSVRQVFDALGAVGYTTSYAPYGTAFESYGDLTTSLGFTGEYTDPTGLLYLRARYLNTDLGMFLTKDPVEGVIDRIMSRNGYSYVEGNVINYTDPSGNNIGDWIRDNIPWEIFERLFPPPPPVIGGPLGPQFGRRYDREALSRWVLGMCREERRAYVYSELMYMQQESMNALRILALQALYMTFAPTIRTINAIQSGNGVAIIAGTLDIMTGGLVYDFMTNYLEGNLLLAGLDIVMIEMTFVGGYQAYRSIRTALRAPRNEWVTVEAADGTVTTFRQLDDGSIITPDGRRLYLQGGGGEPPTPQRKPWQGQGLYTDRVATHSQFGNIYRDGHTGQFIAKGRKRTERGYTECHFCEATW